MKPIPGIRAVTFDAGSTLIEPWPSVGHVYAEIATQHGIGNLTPDLMNRRFAAAWRARRQPLHNAAEWAVIVDETFAGLAAEPPSRTFFPELFERFAQPGAWRIYDDVKPALTALRARGVRLGLISNWDDRLRPLLRALGLMKHFEVVVVSCEAGSAKPAPEIFRKAMAELGLSAGEILHVGDSLDMDVQGARAAGFSAVQIARSVAKPVEGQIRSLLDLLALVCPLEGK